MPLVDLYSSLPHYRQHLEPIWRALPAEVRGREWGRGTWRSREVPADRLVLVASLADYTVVDPRPVVLVEHGAGQTYDGDPRSAGHGSYPGGSGLERVALFVSPSTRVAERWARAYARTPTVVAGSPWLDHLVAGAGSARAAQDLRSVAFTFHWNCPLVPETRSTFPHYWRALPQVVAELRGLGVDLVGHAHPRAANDLMPIWRRLRVRWVPELERVVAQAGVLVGDNTSALYEWAALDRPVVALNAPWYRRSVDHGLRFWDLVPGFQVDDPADLTAAIVDALDHPDRSATLRREAAAAVYAHRDGRAAERAAAAIVEVLHGSVRPEAQGDHR